MVTKFIDYPNNPILRQRIIKNWTRYTDLKLLKESLSKVVKSLAPLKIKESNER